MYVFFEVTTMNIQSIQKIIFILLAGSFNNLHAGGSTCNTGSGEVIVDNTATSAVIAIGANLGFYCDGKSSTAIDDGYGGNAINISDFQVVQRGSDADELQVFVGKSENTISEFQYGTDEQFDLFADGKHLFDLERLRTAADWIRANVTPDSGKNPASGWTIRQ